MLTSSPTEFSREFPWTVPRGSSELALLKSIGFPKNTLPLEQLSPFERVKHQLECFGMRFSGAIALYPSNPNFYENKPYLGLMPAAGRKTIEIDIVKPLQSLALEVRGYYDVRLAALDRDRHILLCCKTFRYRYAETTQAPCETLVIDLNKVKTLILHSTGPFIVASLKV